MYKIFRKHYEVFFRRAFNNKEAREGSYSEINKFKKNKDFKDGEILHRFPKKELRYFLRSECPTERLENQKAVKYYEVIKAAKRLRYFMNIPENFVCTRCSKRETCKFRDLLPKSKETSVSDLLIVTNGLYDYQNQLYGVTEIKEQTKEGEQESNTEKLEAVEEHEEEEEEALSEENDDLSEESDSLSEGEEDLKTEGKAETSKQQEDIEDRYSFKTYESAIKVIDSLYPVIEDIKYRKGFGCKQFINTYIGENKKLGKLRKESQDLDSDDEEIEESNYGRRNRRGFNENSKSSFDQNAQAANRDNIAWGTKPERVPRNESKFSKGGKSNPRTSFEKDNEDINKNKTYGRQINEERNRFENTSQGKRNPRYQNNKFENENDDEFKLKTSPRRGGKVAGRNQTKEDYRKDKFASREEPRNNSRQNREYSREAPKNKNLGAKFNRNQTTADKGRVKLDNFMHDIKLNR